MLAAERPQAFMEGGTPLTVRLEVRRERREVLAPSVQLQPRQRGSQLFEAVSRELGGMAQAIGADIQHWEADEAPGDTTRPFR